MKVSDMTTTDLNPTAEVLATTNATCIAATVDCVLDRVADGLTGKPWGRAQRVTTVLHDILHESKQAVIGTSHSGWAIQQVALALLAQTVAPTGSSLTLGHDRHTLDVGIYNGYNSTPAISEYVLAQRDIRKVQRALRRAARAYRAAQ
jgi:hypothetical protein